MQVGPYIADTSLDINTNQCSLKSDIDAHLSRKLLSGLDYIRRHFVFGSSNKVSDRLALGDWAHQINRRYKVGVYKKIILNESMYEDNAFTPDPEEKKTIKYHWCFTPSTRYKNAIKIIPNNHSIDPLGDSVFNIDIFQEDLLINAIFGHETRYGNCGIKSSAICKYLWERPKGIHKIENVSCVDFDHGFVIVNRKNENINDVSGWGDAWIIDPWFEDGVIYHASEFEYQFPKIIEFTANQLHGFVKMGLSSKRLDPSSVSNKLEVLVTIEPHINKYPSYGDPKLTPVESYYSSNTLLPLGKSVRPNDYLISFNKLHKKKFSECVTDIESRSNNFTPPSKKF